MANLNRIANIQILLQTSAISALGFSNVMIISPHVHSLNTVDTYYDTNDLLLLGHQATDPIYLAALAVMSQSPGPGFFKLGRRQVDAVSIATQTLTPLGTYTMTLTSMVGGVLTPITFTYTDATGTPTSTSVLSGLSALVGSTGPASSAVGSSLLNLTNRSAGTAFTVQVSSNLLIQPVTAVNGVSADLATIAAYDNDFYGFSILDRTQANIMLAAAWAESQAAKLHVTTISEVGAYSGASTTDTMYMLKAQNYFRSICYYHAAAATEYLGLAAMAKAFGSAPGADDWANMTLAGITADNLSETQSAAIAAKNGNTFEPFKNLALTQYGKVAGGEWADVIRFRDWLQEAMRVEIIDAMVNSKTPYTDPGIAIIEAAMRSVLLLGQAVGGISPTQYDASGNPIPGFKIYVPLRASIPVGDVAARTLNNMKFTAILAGAIHIVNVQGTLTYNMSSTQ